MAVALAEQVFDVFAQWVVAIVELAGKAIVEKSGGRRRALGALKSDVETVVAQVDPRKCLAQMVGGHENSQAFRADGALDGTAPVTFFRFDFHEFGNEWQFSYGKSEMCGEVFAKGLKWRGNV